MRVTDPELVSVCNHRPCTPSAAVQEINHQISPTAKTPHFDPDIHKPVTTAGDDGKTEKEDSFVANIESRTPAKMTESIPIASLSITRSDETPPLAHGSPSRRIEDSVAALDALEEEIEKVGSLIPKISDLEHPAPLKKQTKPSSKPRKLERSKGTSCALDKTHSALRNKPSVTASSKAPRAPSQATKMSPRHGKSPNQNPAATLPSATISRPKTMSQDGHKPRVSSIHKTPFQPTKSTKPPTKSTFELPGEAVSRRLKEQREERQSAQEDPEPKKHTFKARPNPLRQSQAPEVKLTAATRARLSIAAGKGAPRTSNVHEKAKSNPISMGTINANKRTSSIYIPKRSSIPPTQKAPNQRASSITGSLANRTSSSSNAPPPTSEDLAHQKVKGKEVFGRARAQIQEREKARKEKEEAAKKARAEAAERGRIASREWAEKQKARQMGEKKAGQQAKTEGN